MRPLPLLRGMDEAMAADDVTAAMIGIFLFTAGSADVDQARPAAQPTRSAADAVQLGHVLVREEKRCPGYVFAQMRRR